MNKISIVTLMFFAYSLAIHAMDNPLIDNSYDDNMYLTSSSAPVMKPIISEGSTYWYAGDNLFTGSPSDAGILFDEDAYPDMNYGYNKFELTGNSYYINGANPTGGGEDFYVIENYWGGTPVSGKFNVSNADVVYESYNDNVSEARGTNNLTMYDIGFGLSDTVLFYEPDNPNFASDLYLEANQKEHSEEFTDAITIYKEIIEDHRDSSYAISCLSRIFNCYERKGSTQIEYSLLETYYETISIDTSYKKVMTNIAEDFMIKCKVKQGNTEEAISDYNTIYINNLSNSMGIHALINKEILLASLGTGDNTGSNPDMENMITSQERINEIISSIGRKEKNIISGTNLPDKFSLEQNYPNPFNPSTTISYEIPKAGVISLKVYDIAGREVADLINEFKPAGRYSISFNAAGLSSGVYFYRISRGNNFEIKKMVLIK